MMDLRSKVKKGRCPELDHLVIISVSLAVFVDNARACLGHLGELPVAARVSW